MQKENEVVKFFQELGDAIPWLIFIHTRNKKPYCFNFFFVKWKHSLLYNSTEIKMKKKVYWWRFAL